jgi:hypothetical protein
MRDENGRFIKGHEVPERWRKGIGVAIKNGLPRHTQPHTDLSKKKISINRTGKMCGSQHPNWKGGRWKHSSGYIGISIKGFVMLEHRYIMEQHIGRKLAPEERVHHVNGIKDDNRVENLILLPSESEHQKYHYAQKTA